MKSHLNIAPAALLASTFTTPSVSAARLGFTDYDGDHATKTKKVSDQLVGRNLYSSKSGKGGKSEKNSDTCYIGQKFLDELDKDPSARCCLMPPLYYFVLASTLGEAGGPFLSKLIEEGCKNVIQVPLSPPPERPVCYETAFQISLWGLWTKSTSDGVTDYPVCDGTVISPGLLTPSGGLNETSIFAGIIDSPLVVSIPNLNLYCEGDDHGCTFDGGEYQVLSLPLLPGFPDPAAGTPFTLVPDTSNLKIEGFKFTGEMKSGWDLGQGYKYSIYLAAAGKNMTIKNNVFADVTNPVNETSCRGEGYSAISANPAEKVPFAFNTGILDIQVTIEDNIFENIDVGSYPVYAPEDPKKCSFCYYETKETYAESSLILNLGQEVDLKSNTFEKNIANRVYGAFPTEFFLVQYEKDEDANTTEVEAKYGCDDKPCFAGVIEDNMFKKNEVRSLVLLWDSKNETSTVTLSNNEGECDQTYTGGEYCPLYFVADTYKLLKERLGNDAAPFENCAGQPQFCFNEKRVTALDPLSGVCEELCLWRPQWLVLLVHRRGLWKGCQDVNGIPFTSEVGRACM